MIGNERFAVFIAVSFVVFLVVLWFSLRRRGAHPWPRFVGLALVVVVGGMLFAKWGQNSALPWWIYYTLPALATFLLPPIALRMSWREAGVYLALAVLMAPAIHAFFSFFVGWPDYMPFIPVPSLAELMRR